MSTHVGPIDVDALRARLDKAATAATVAGVDALLITPGSDLRYLIGAGGSSFERLTCLVLPVGGTPVLVVPKLEQPGYAAVPTGELGVDVATWVDGEDPYALVRRALKGTDRVAVADMMPALHNLSLRDAIGGDQVLAGPILRELRMRKDASEVEALRKAGAAIDRVHARVGEWLRPGRTEAEVGADIAAAIVAEGHELAEFVIVGSGPNGASPHHSLSDRVIEAGDVVVVDIGGPVAEGYNSDSTRTYVLGEPRDKDVWDTYAVLQAAQRAAVDAVKPGVTCESIDAAAREVIADAGFGEYFVHRTGHGIGLDVHEEPYIVGGNDLVLEAGMAFSVEPGIYLPGRWGARIEDIVIATDTGVESVNNRPHDLVVLPA
ncbi:Xaa-Pro peptidase family protein [Actinosynnema sp. NPDC047251]|uniref:Putative dipeptidase pepE n=1 Tax=Saccharothrix espanaensis (strain ATCC 51144 / DSM 44229 / JCM 9112 / NBRC 15066 / NRRL 15764) TaxID=1179773 RepID=K0JZ21_SACES|nr:Xaa-Pro peptidase family protein [Saccharothrix espanaensis]CCH30512.1 putative dipeptidase pepE [Saccharothrix espanaensis DSM 44229]